MAGIVTLQPGEWVLMIISDNAVAGVTRLQKYGFLLHKQYRKEISKIERKYGVFFYDDWKAHYYGPYSERLAKDIKTCVERNLLQTQDEGIPPKNYLRYEFTPKGRKIWRDVLCDNTKEISDINDKVRYLQATSTSKLLREIYLEYPAYTIKSRIKEGVLSD